ncbi:MAG: TylF/MycF family methyltransferase [Desulfarculaceae bacterium]|nr:TylF/MycF family methyltransferase [Desulfarculaceae bacterium]
MARFSDLINRLKAGQGQQPSPEPSIPEQPSLELVRELESLEPGITDKLLAILGQGHGPTPVEERRYQLAEALTTAVYPKYKFCEFGRLFLEDEEFLAYYRKIMDPNNWHSLDRKYTLNQLLKLVLHLEGDLAECGVYKGASAQLMCRAALPLGKTVHLFDSFQGLPAPQNADGSYWEQGRFATTEEDVASTLEGLGNYLVYAGWIPERFNQVADRSFCFVHVDVDLAQPTLDSIEFFYPRLSPGGIMLFDDHGFKSCPGARQVTEEFFAGKTEELVLLSTGQAMVMKRCLDGKKKTPGIDGGKTGQTVGSKLL